MDDEVDTPRWELTIQSPTIEQVESEYKFKLKYGGFFRLARNSNKKVYSFGYSKSLCINTWSYNLGQLVEEVKKHYTSERDGVLSIMFVDKHAKEQHFIELDSDEKFMLMINSVCASEESYHSRHSSDSEYDLNYDSESYTYSEHNAIMKVNSKFPTVVAFRRALNHYALTNEFEYVTDLTRLTACCADKQCEWRIHASLTQDGVTFEVKKFVEIHSCTQSNKCENKHATRVNYVTLFMHRDQVCTSNSNVLLLV